MPAGANGAASTFASAPPDRVAVVLKGDADSRARAYRRLEANRSPDGGLYDWPASVIDADFVRRYRRAVPDGEPVVVETPTEGAAIIHMPARWPFWADNDERRARWAAMIVAQRTARTVVPDMGLDACRRCRTSIVSGRLRLYGPPERYARGSAEWQRTARLCAGARRMMDVMPSLGGHAVDTVAVSLAHDLQRALVAVREQTDGFCSPSCAVAGTDLTEGARPW
jgi:hypothetical protein